MRIRISAIMVQSAIRCRLVLAGSRQRLLARRKIQRFCVEHFVHQLRMRDREHAATVVQRSWRAIVGHSNYQSSRCAVITLQAKVRCQLASSRYRLVRSKCVIIQSWARMVHCKPSYRNAVSAAIAIQNQWRLTTAQARLTTARYLAIALQSIARGRICRSLLKGERNAVLLVQRVWRGRQGRFCVLETMQQRTQVPSAMIIQSYYRTRRCQRDFKAALSSIITIQSVWRKKVRQNQKAACTIQQWWRYREDLLRRNRASIAMQRCIRGHQSRSFIDSKSRHAILIQQTWRRAGAEHSYMLKRASSIMLQCAIRGFIARQGCRHAIREQEMRLDSAMKIQASWRRYICLEIYSRQRGSCILLQTFFRGVLASLHLKRCIAASTVLACAIRVRGAKISFTNARRAAISLQKMWRAALIHNKFEVQRTCAMIIQSVYRRHLVERVYWFLKAPIETRRLVDAAARRIQIAYFLWKMRLAVDEVQSSAILLNRCMRGQLVRSTARFALSHMNASFQRSGTVASAVSFISDEGPQYADALLAWDSSVVQAKGAACVVIQSAARRLIARSRVERACGRRFCSRLQVDQRLAIREERSAYRIQRLWRIRISRKLCAALKIQSVSRDWIARRNHSVLLSTLRQELENVSAVTIQQLQRGWICKQLYLQTKWRVVQIQKQWRSAVTQKHFNSSRRAAIYIQRSVRRCLSKLQLARLRLESRARSEAATENVWHRVVARSEERVAILHRSSEDTAPCLMRLVDRVQYSLQEAARAANNPLPQYASLALKDIYESPLIETSHGTGMEERCIDAENTFLSFEDDVAIATDATASTPVRRNSKSFSYDALSDGEMSWTRDYPDGMHTAAAVVETKNVSRQSPLKPLHSQKTKAKQMPSSGIFLRGREPIDSAPTLLATVDEAELGSRNPEIFPGGAGPSPIKSGEKWAWADEW
jgi:hypothetical protein